MLRPCLLSCLIAVTEASLLCIPAHVPVAIRGRWERMMPSGFRYIDACAWTVSLLLMSTRQGIGTKQHACRTHQEDAEEACLSR
jgi:hypothetical protein